MKSRFAGLMMTSLVVLASGCTSTVHATRSVRYYVSLGDSYSVGYQPSPTPGATAGYTAFVAARTGLTLENFGCGGATTATILRTDGCLAPYGPGASSHAVAYSTTTQAAAAESFITAHRGSIGLVTVSIGGNDVTACARAADPVTCVVNAVGTIKTNVTKLARQLRGDAGPGVPIIGLTYPDVILGLWVYPPGKTQHGLATLSVTAFHDFINPTLKAAYAGARATFLDITSATDAYVPLTDLTTLAAYGQIPKAVAEVCALTWYCSLGNIHANTAGYSFIGRQIAAEYARMQHH